MDDAGTANVRPPLGGWPKWDGAIHVRDGEPTYDLGALYLTDRRLFFKPGFFHPAESTLTWNISEIEGLGNDMRPWILFLSHLHDWLRRPFYLRARGEQHYFATTRNEEWLSVLAEASGLEPSLRNARN
jgi:hypothetical protein